MPDDTQPATDMPVGMVDASGEPMPIEGVTPPTTPAMIDDDAQGEINGISTDDLSVQGGE